MYRKLWNAGPQHVPVSPISCCYVVKRPLPVSPKCKYISPLLPPHSLQSHAQRQNPTPSPLPQNIHPLIPLPKDSLQIPRHGRPIPARKHDRRDRDERPIFQRRGQDAVLLGKEEGSEEGRRQRARAGREDAGGQKNPVSTADERRGRRSGRLTQRSRKRRRARKRSPRPNRPAQTAPPPGSAPSRRRRPPARCPCAPT